MALIVNDLVPTEAIEFEKLPSYKPDYEHVKCRCGGIIGGFPHKSSHHFFGSYVITW